ncbi:transcriptional regulator [Streptosporangium sp. NPDC048047]|uniref:transcriptional regulator n=1 Tax=Streptosporangium sp. NPDC048047 TaxID=3155748 RepID=UPI003439A9EB
MTSTTDLAAFAAVFAALFAARSVGDHWVQTHHQACAKGAPTAAGRLACAGHVLTLTVTKAAFLLAVQLVTGLQLALVAVYVGLAVDAASHYWADRRVTLAALAERLGKGGFYRLGTPRPGTDDAPHLGTGAYALDQSWHIGWLFVTALIITA